MPACTALEFVLVLAAAAAPAQAEHAAHGTEHPASHAMPMEMSGALGSYPMARDASGTAWQPDSTAHAMGHVMRGAMPRTAMH